MSPEKPSEFSKDWARLFHEGKLTGSDLYQLADEIMSVQHKYNPSFIPKDVNELYEDPTEVSLQWKNGSLDLTSQEPTTEAPYETINVSVRLGRKHVYTEDFQLRRHTNEEVTAHWFRNEILSSIILNEELEEDKPVEVVLTPERIEKIGRVFLSAHAVKMAGLNQ